MKKILLCIIVVLSIAPNLSACNPDEDNPLSSEIEMPKPNDNNEGENPALPENTDNMKLKITIGAKSYTATLYDNATAKEFKTMLPMTLTMNEHNRNEKYSNLSDRLACSNYIKK